MKLDRELFLNSLPENLKPYGERHIEASNASSEKFEIQRWHISIGVLTKLGIVPQPIDPNSKSKTLEVKVPSTNKLGNDSPEVITQEEADRLIDEIVKNLRPYGAALRTDELVWKLEFCKVQNFFTENHLRAVMTIQVNR
jgi:hypothetical protein